MRLLSLEYLVLGVLLLLVGGFVKFGLIFILVYLVYTACEGALGLAILVNLTRSHGGDYFSGFYMY